MERVLAARVSAASAPLAGDSPTFSTAVPRSASGISSFAGCYCFVRQAITSCSLRLRNNNILSDCSRLECGASATAIPRMDYQQSDGIYDMPDEPLFTLNLRLSHSNDLDRVHKSFTSKIDKARSISRVKGSKRKEFVLTPEGPDVFTIAFTDGTNTVTAIIEERNMWLRGFQTADGHIFEFNDEHGNEGKDANLDDKTDEMNNQFNGNDKTRDEEVKDEEEAIKDQKLKVIKDPKMKAIKDQGMNKHCKQKEKSKAACGSKKKQVNRKDQLNPKKYIRGSVLLRHDSNYGSLLGPNRLPLFQVGYSTMRDMLHNLAHFDPNNYSDKHKRSMASLIIHTAETLKNKYISSLVLNSFNPHIGARLQALDDMGAAHINGWSTASELILKSIHLPSKVWDFQQQEFSKCNEFYKNQCWTTDPNVAMKSIVFLKGDAYMDSKLSVKDGDTITISHSLNASVGVVVMGGINHILMHNWEVPCAAEISLKASSYSAKIPIVEGEVKVFTDHHNQLYTSHLKLSSKEGQKEVKRSLVKWRMKKFCGMKRAKHVQIMIRIHKDLIMKYRDTIDKMIAEKAKRAMNLFPSTDPLLLLSTMEMCNSRHLL
uniref:rRNA N-glycosylase n=1 Tax=Oryza glumipatula TaxID=40148 RepID=A0A0D9YUZ5_9ORYZ